MKEIIDHRTVKSDISLGGTSQAFVLETRSGGPSFVAKIENDRGETTQVEALYEKDRLFRVIFQNGMEATYDYGGNLAKLKLSIVNAYRDLPETVFGQLELDTATAVQMMVEHESELMLEIDLADGLSLGDMSGWLQITADKNLKKTDGGIGGREIWPEAEPLIRQIMVNDIDGVLVGFVYVTTGLVGGQLVVGVGDKNIISLLAFRRLIDPERLTLAKNPVGTRALVDSLMD